MKNFLPKLLFFYSALASIFIAVSIALTSQSIAPIIFGVLFLPVAAYFIIEFFRHLKSLTGKKTGEVSDLTFSPKKGDVVVIILLFLALLGVALRNISVKGESSQSKNAPIPSSAPLIFKRTTTAVTKVEVDITDGSPMINIRAKPSIYSDKIGTAKDGDIFEYNQKTSGWYAIKMPDGTTGYLSDKYAKEVSSR